MKDLTMRIFVEAFEKSLNSENLEGPPDLDLCISKKSWPRDTPIRLHVNKSEKSWDFEKIKLKIMLEYSDKTPFFWGLKIFWKAPKKFFIDFTNMFKVFERSA